MPIKLLTSTDDLARYDAWVKQHPQGSLWQSLEWKRYQESLGRETRIYGAISDQGLAASALVIIDRTTGGICTWDCARGPLSESSEILEEMINDAQKDRCMSIYLSPTEKLIANRYPLTASSRHQQPEATRILDLTMSDEQLLAQMHQKGRYNINVARKNNVHVERSNDIDAYYALAQKTGKRDAFGIPSKKQLQTFLEHLPGSFLLLAYTSNENKSGEIRETENENHSKLETRNLCSVAGLLGVTWNGTGIYYYGASDYEHRALMAPYLLQWEAIQLSKKAGCRTYDLLGVAPADAQADHPWSGISDFKSKFGGTVISYPHEQEITLKPLVKQLLEVKRKIFG